MAIRKSEIPALNYNHLSILRKEKTYWVNHFYNFAKITK